MNETTTPRTEDLEHLRLLAIFHHVVAIIVALVASVFIFHVAMGAMFVFRPDAFGDEPVPGFVGVMLMVMGALAVLLGWATAICLVVAGRSLVRHRRYTFCLATAGVSCVFAPFGTVLGVFTLLVLLRPSVKALFGVAPAVPVPVE